MFFSVFFFICLPGHSIDELKNTTNVSLFLSLFIIFAIKEIGDWKL